MMATVPIARFCSVCGQPLVRQWISSEQHERSVCKSCGNTHYENPRIIVCCIVCWGHKLLLCRRANEPGKGKWMIPGGFLECGETLEAAAARETLEETGLVVDPNDLTLYSVVNMTAINQVLISFRVALSVEPVLSPGPECLDAKFMSENEMRKIEFAWRTSMGDGQERFFNELRSGMFTVQLITLATDFGTEFKWRAYPIRQPDQ